MRRLSKLIPRSAGGRWAAGLSLAGLVGIGIYLVFFVFAFHLIFVDEVVDEEAPEFASEADIDQLISEALDVAAATAGGARTTDSDREATEQPMSVGEHEVEGSDADGSDSAGAAEGSSTGLVDESSDGAESGEAYSSAADGSDAASSGGGNRNEASGSDASGAADASDGGAAADDSDGNTAGQADGQDRDGSSVGDSSTNGDDDAAGTRGSDQADDGDTGSGGSGQADDRDQGDGNTGSDSGGHQGDSSTGGGSGGDQGDGDSGDSGDHQGDEGVRVSHVGSFGPRSHPAEGAVVVLTDGTQTVLRFDDSFATDNGPDLNVYLHTAGPDASVDDLVADFIDLGDLKGNIGAQNYAVGHVDLDRYSTVSVWCVRFRVVFGTAELMPMN